jgi:hypothetical protein
MDIINEFLLLKHVLKFFVQIFNSKNGCVNSVTCKNLNHIAHLLVVVGT